MRQGGERLLETGVAADRMIAPRKRPGAEPPCLQIERVDDQPEDPRNAFGRSGAVDHPVSAVRTTIALKRGAGQCAGVRTEAQTARKRALKIIGVRRHTPGCLCERHPGALLHSEGDRIVGYDRLGQGQGNQSTNLKTKPKRCTFRLENVGVADVVSAEEGPSGIDRGAGPRKDPLVREESHPLRTAFDTRLVGRNSAGDAKWKPVLDNTPRRKIKLQRSRILILSRKADRQITYTAGGERKSKTNKDYRLDAFHRSKPLARKTYQGGRKRLLIVA